MSREYPVITELEINSVVHRGVPNQECIVIKPKLAVDISPFAVCVGRRTVGEVVTPVRDLFFWFGEGTVHPVDWVFLFTGAGEPSRQQSPDGEGAWIFVYWGRPTTLFHDSIYTPFLLRYDGIQIAAPPNALLQG
jgi:hypothetical protein